jgi:hypothetical protein
MGMIYNAKMPEAYARVEWCKEAFGPTDEFIEYKYGNNIAEGLRWWRRQGHLYFRNEQDYMLYTLRWA